MTDKQFFVVCLMIVVGYIAYIFKAIFVEWYKARLKVNDVPFETLIIILNSLINMELDLYENDLFSAPYSINNSQFENYYNDISTTIANNLSPSFMREITKYITEEAVIRIIARRVKQYLTNKIGA